MLELHRGQGKDIIWRDSNQCPTEKEYKEMVKQSLSLLLIFSYCNLIGSLET